MKVYTLIQAAKLMDSNCKSLDGKPYIEAVFKSTDIWNNGACLGYLLQSCIDEGIDKKTMHRLLNAMHYAFATMSVEEAYELYDRKMR